MIKFIKKIFKIKSQRTIELEKELQLHLNCEETIKKSREEAKRILEVMSDLNKYKDY